MGGGNLEGDELMGIMGTKRLLAVLACASIGLVAICTTTLATTAGASVAGSSWTLAPTSSSIGGGAGMAYGDGKFIVLPFFSPNEEVMTSPDGVNWTTQSVGLVQSQNWGSVVYANGLFVAVAVHPNQTNNDQVMTSPDGINWTYRSSPVSEWISITYGNGLFVAVGNQSGNDPIVMTSPDGINWTARSTPDDTTQLNAVAYGNGMFVASAYEPGTSGYQLMTSPDGITWTGHIVPFGCYDSNAAVAYGNGTWVVMGVATNSPCTTATFLTSHDNGVTWQEHDPGNGSEWLNIFYTGSNFVAIAANDGVTHTPIVMTSPDATTWTSQSAPSYFWNSAALGNGILVAVTLDGTYAMTTSLIPSPPLSVATSLQPTGVQVSWSTPLDDGGSPIMSYTATASPGGKTCTSTTTSCVITGLIAGATYSITVTATNVAGNSAPSAPVSVTLPPAAELSSTGSDLFSPSWLSGALLALGGGALFVRHRRSVRSRL